MRPYMYWLKFLSTGEEAGVLDWKAIGGTWGSATSKLHTWQPKCNHLPGQLYDVCNNIEQSGDKNGVTMSLYVHKFFDDMYLHLYNLRSHLKKDAHLYYILGNSTFYGNVVNTDEWILTIIRDLGYHNVQSKIIRKRNSKSQLYEYLIEAEW